jgi:hypothetical protein
MSLLVLCGGLKIVYDISLLLSFRHLKPPEEREDRTRMGVGSPAVERVDDGCQCEPDFGRDSPSRQSRKALR